MISPGHEAAWQAWRSALAGERMHHAWLLAGKQGLGKLGFARLAARELLDEPGIPQPEGLHPDILELTYGPKDKDEEKKREDGKEFELARSIRIGQIRELQHRLTMRPTMGSRRVVIINPADDLERNAANALLKSLEEPPVGTFMLLVAHRPARLLPTIRSRCRLLRFSELGEAGLRSNIMAENPDAEMSTIEAAVMAAAGSPGAAQRFLEQDLGQVFEVMQSLVRDGDPRFELRERLIAAVKPRPDRERMSAVFDLARAIVASRRSETGREDLPAVIEAHAGLVTLGAQSTTYNFDAGLLVAEIGSLLASAAETRERADA